MIRHLALNWFCFWITEKLTNENVDESYLCFKIIMLFFKKNFYLNGIEALPFLLLIWKKKKNSKKHSFQFFLLQQKLLRSLRLMFQVIWAFQQFLLKYAKIFLIFNFLKFCIYIEQLWNWCCIWFYGKIFVLKFVLYFCCFDLTCWKEDCWNGLLFGYTTIYLWLIFVFCLESKTKLIS